MGSLAKINGAVGAELQLFILAKMKGKQRSSVVSTDAIIRDIRTAMPSCPLSTERLAVLISESAILLGVVPVLDRGRLADNHDKFSGVSSHGHPTLPHAHPR